jgi:hypothetical protein
MTATRPAPPRGPGRRAILASMAIPFDQREALRMLAGSPNGSTESILLTHGFAIGMLHALVSSGLATAERRTVPAGRELIEVQLMTITDAGRQALAE